MAPLKRPCPHCLRPMDAARALCPECEMKAWDQADEPTISTPPPDATVYNSSQFDQTIFSPPHASPDTRVASVLAVLVILLVIGIGLLTYHQMQQVAGAPQVARSEPQPTPPAPVVTPPPANITPLAPPYVPPPASAPVPTYEQVNEQVRTELRKVVHADDLFNDMDARFRNTYQFVTSGPAGYGRTPAQAEYAVADYNSRVEGAVTAGKAVFERASGDPLLSVPSAQAVFGHLLNAMDAYKSAGGSLKSYLLTGDAHWAAEAAESYSKARSERTALEIALGNR